MDVKGLTTLPLMDVKGLRTLPIVDVKVFKNILCYKYKVVTSSEKMTDLEKEISRIL